MSCTTAITLLLLTGFGRCFVVGGKGERAAMHAGVVYIRSVGAAQDACHHTGHVCLWMGNPSIIHVARRCGSRSLPCSIPSRPPTNQHSHHTLSSTSTMEHCCCKWGAAAKGLPKQNETHLPNCCLRETTEKKHRTMASLSSQLTCFLRRL